MEKGGFRKDVWTVGLALFAMFFGAGNAIFPPYVGLQTAPDWILPTLLYVAADVIVAILAIVVMVRND